MRSDPWWVSNASFVYRRTILARIHTHRSNLAVQCHSYPWLLGCHQRYGTRQMAISVATTVTDWWTLAAPRILDSFCGGVKEEKSKGENNGCASSPQLFLPHNKMQHSELLYAIGCQANEAARDLKSGPIIRTRTRCQWSMGSLKVRDRLFSR